MTKSTKLSAVLIVKDEEDKIEECLRSIAFADEIIVLDSGSTDSTLDIAKKMGAKVEVVLNWQGFGVQRQRAQALATGDWVLCIDADERVSNELRISIEAAIQGPECIYEVNRLSWCFGRYMRHTGMYPDWIPRLYPRRAAWFDNTAVHERLTNPNRLPVRRLKGHLLHMVYNSVRHLVSKSALYSEMWAEFKFLKGSRSTLLVASLHSFFCFIRMYFLKRGFLDGGQGFMISIVMSHATFVKYADLWVRNKTSD